MGQERFLKALDRIRGIPGRIKLRDGGLRTYSVTIRVRTWNGSRPGIDASTSTHADTTFWVDAGKHKPRVQQVSQRDIMTSGGLYQDQDLRVGPITPPYAGGAANHSDTTVFDPVPGAAPTEVFFLVQGPGMGANGAWYEKVSQTVTRPFRYEFVIRKTGKIPPPEPSSPTQVPGILAWYRADLGVTQAGGKASAWADQSGNVDGTNRTLQQATPAKQPTYTVSDGLLGGQPSISSAYLTEQWMQTGVWSTPLAQPCTALVVGYYTTTAHECWAFDSGAGAESGLVANRGPSTVRLFGGSSYSSSPVALAFNTPAVFLAQLDSVGGSSLWVSQGTGNAQGAVGTSAPSPLLILDAAAGAGSYTGWTLAELAFWNRDLTQAEVNLLTNYAGSRYGIAIGP